MEGIKNEADRMQTVNEKKLKRMRQREIGRGKMEVERLKATLLEELDGMKGKVQGIQSDHKQELERMESYHQNQEKGWKSEIGTLHQRLVEEAQAMQKNHEAQMESMLRDQRETMQNAHRIELETERIAREEEVDEVMTTLHQTQQYVQGLREELETTISDHGEEVETLQASLNEIQEELATITQDLDDVEEQRAAREDELAVLTRANQEEIANNERRKREIAELEKEKSEWQTKIGNIEGQFDMCIIVIVVLVVAILSGFGTFVGRWCCKLGKGIAEKGIDGKMPKMRLSLKHGKESELPVRFDVTDSFEDLK